MNAAAASTRRAAGFARLLGTTLFLNAQGCLCGHVAVMAYHTDTVTAFINRRPVLTVRDVLPAPVVEHIGTYGTEAAELIQRARRREVLV
jgi:hypothetical protein